MAGAWTHQDLVTDRFTFEDLLDIHEMLDVKARNERNYRAWVDAQRGEG